MSDKNAGTAVTLPNAYLAKPNSSLGKGVLVIHAWWGLNKFFKDLCDRLAGEGFLVMAPDLYHGKTATTIDDAKRLRSKLKQETVAQEITQIADRLHELCCISGQGLGVLGFSLGAYWGLWLAEQKSSLVTATIAFYGTRNGDYSTSQSAFQFHLAEKDDYVATSGVKKLQKSLSVADKVAAFYTYPGTGHWFFESDRPETYQPQAAQLAWNRSVEFLKLYV